ncbi:MAG: glycosyltransferase [Bacteroidota bacterium]
MNRYAPVVLFVYNRPEHTRKTLESLSRNPESALSDLFIFCDGPKKNTDEMNLEKIKEVRKVIREKTWCKNIIISESEVNKGLADSVISGVTQILSQHDKVIVLEDDLVLSSGFLKYMNTALDRYRDNSGVWMISGYNFPVKEIKADHSAYFIPLTSTQAWATWKRAWAMFDPQAKGYEELKTNTQLRREFNLNDTFDYSSMLISQMETQNISSWAIRLWWSVFRSKGLVLYPDKSLIANTGWDGSGAHCSDKNPYQDSEWDPEYYIEKFPAEIKANPNNFYKLIRYFKNLNGRFSKPTFFQRIMGKIRQLK